MIRRRFLPDQAVGGSQSGFTLLEVLLATVLLAVPVVAVQTLMLQSVSHGRGTAQQQLALQAGETALSRIFAFHSLGLWPDHLTPPGSWLPALAATITPQGIGRTAASCVNRWCSLDQWVAYEHASVACALDFRAGSSACDEMVADDAWWPQELPVGGSSRPVRTPRLVGFQATFTADGGLGLELAWPGDALPAGVGGIALEPRVGWQQISLGVSP